MIIDREMLRRLHRRPINGWECAGCGEIQYPCLTIMLLDELEAAERKLTEYLHSDYTVRVAELAGELEMARQAAERRLALLKELEWGEEYTSQKAAGIWWRDCPSCGRDNEEGHAPDCGLAAELAGQVVT